MHQITIALLVRLRGFTFRVLGFGIRFRLKVEGFMVRIQV